MTDRLRPAGPGMNSQFLHPALHDRHNRTGGQRMVRASDSDKYVRTRAVRSGDFNVVPYRVGDFFMQRKLLKTPMLGAADCNCPISPINIREAKTTSFTDAQSVQCKQCQNRL